MMTNRSCGDAHANSGDAFSLYLREFLRFNPPAMGRVVLLNVATAWIEGAGMILLLPLLTLAGVFGRKGDESSLAGNVLASLGFKWSIEAALAVFVVLIALQSWLVLHRDRESRALHLRFSDSLRQRLYAAIAGARWSFLLERHSGELLNVLTTEVQRIGTGTHFLVRVFTVSLSALAYAFVAFRMSPGLASLAVVTCMFLWLLLRSTDSLSRRSGALLGEANRNLFSRTQDFLSALKLVKIHGEEAGNINRFCRAVDAVTDRFEDFHKANTRAQMAFRIGGALALAILTYVALELMELTPARLLVMLAIFVRMLPQVAEISNGRQQLLHMLPAFEAWHGLLAACEKQRDTMAAAAGVAAPMTEGIVLDRVDFSHGRSHLHIHIESLSIPAMATTAIVGESGAGKSTLLDLLSGLLAPDRGDIRVDEIPLGQVPEWRRSIAYVPQETLIQSGSIRENLAWGNEVPGDGDLWHALSLAALDGLVRRLPNGLDTEVGERGVKLSGGEKQRLALARALLRKPTLLILDEATSALDPDNHRLVLDTIRSLHGSMTVLVVTHRHEELVGLIDGVVEVDNGIVGAWHMADEFVA